MPADARSVLNSFCRIFVERRLMHCDDVKQILSQAGSMPIQWIDTYQEVFWRKNQNFQIQKHHPALILAKKSGQFVYAANERINSWHQAQVYYTDQLRNCPYNCDYCFLQGMHSSGHIVLFCNYQDYLEAAVAQSEQGAVHLSVSYLSDILALEPLLPVSERWIETCRNRPQITLEIRTKSDHTALFRRVAASPNCVLVWSMSPPAVADSIERGTASFQNRLFAALTAINTGWRVRICFDPVILITDWQSRYQQCIDETFRRLPAEKIEMVSVGTFRMSADQLAKIRKQRKDSLLIHSDYAVADGLASYPSRQRELVWRWMGEQLGRHLPATKISFVHG